MLAESKNSTEYKELLKRAVNHVVSRGFSSVKAELEGYEHPTHYLGQKDRKVNYCPDITAVNGKGKFYFEIAKKTESTRELVSKWKLLETMAELKNGKLNILVPFGQNRFAQDLITEHNINAKLIKLD